MPVLITAVVPGQTREGYDQTMVMLSLAALNRPRVSLLTERVRLPKAGEYLRFGNRKKKRPNSLRSDIHPHLPPGVTPKRT